MQLYFKVLSGAACIFFFLTQIWSKDTSYYCISILQLNLWPLYTSVRDQHTHIINARFINGKSLWMKTSTENKMCFLMKTTPLCRHIKVSWGYSYYHRSLANSNVTVTDCISVGAHVYICAASNYSHFHQDKSGHGAECQPRNLGRYHLFSRCFTRVIKKRSPSNCTGQGAQSWITDEGMSETNC